MSRCAIIVEDCPLARFSLQYLLPPPALLFLNATVPFLAARSFALQTKTARFALKIRRLNGYPNESIVVAKISL